MNPFESVSFSMPITILLFIHFLSSSSDIKDDKFQDFKNMIFSDYIMEAQEGRALHILPHNKYVRF